MCASRKAPPKRPGARPRATREPRRRRKYRSVATKPNSGERHTAKRVAAVRRTVRRSAMVGLGLNLSGVARGDGLAAPLTSRGDADGNVNVHEKTVGPEETRRGEASSSSGSDDDSDDDAPIAERPTPTTRPAGLPSLGLGLGARGAAAAGGSSASSPTSPPSGTSLSARKPPGLGLRIGGGGGAGDVGSGGGRPSAIDLESLRDSGETHASELTIRREKFAHFEKHCTRVAPSVFVAGEAVARDLATLREHGITHVINCNAFVIPNHHEDTMTYKTLWLQDSPNEDVTRVLYDCFDFIRAARAAGGNALVHCSQGVSRSVSVAVSFVMWETGASYEDAFAHVKAQRGIANPNMGFTCQMLQWRKRVAAEAAWGRRAPDSSDPLSVPKTRVYRLAPHSEHDPRYLVAKPVEVALDDTLDTASLWSTLDARGAFVVAPPTRARDVAAAYVWVGPRCVDERAFVDRARAVARQLFEYDGLASAWRRHADETENENENENEETKEEETAFEETARVVVVRGGEEPADLARALGAGRDDVAPSGAWAGAASARVAAYDADFEMYVAGPQSPRAGAGRWHTRATERTERTHAERMEETPLEASETPLEKLREAPSDDGDGGDDGDDGDDVGAPSTSPLLTYPGFEPVTMYDEDDLDTASIFVLLAPRGLAKGGPEDAAARAFVWVGGGADRADGAEACAARVAETFGEQCVVRVENEGSESEAFWEAFEAGQA